jgi:hypothetical protein
MPSILQADSLIKVKDVIKQWIIMKQAKGDNGVGQIS